MLALIRAERGEVMVLERLIQGAQRLMGSLINDTTDQKTCLSIWQRLDGALYDDEKQELLIDMSCSCVGIWCCPDVLATLLTLHGRLEGRVRIVLVWMGGDKSGFIPWSISFQNSGAEEDGRWLFWKMAKSLYGTPCGHVVTGVPGTDRGILRGKLDYPSSVRHYLDSRSSYFGKKLTEQDIEAFLRMRSLGATVTLPS